MELTILDRFKNAWDAFSDKNRTSEYGYTVGEVAYGRRPDRPRFTRGNERSIVTAIYNKIAIDVSQLSIRHVRLDENDRYKETIKGSLNTCLTLSANIDQTSRSFIQDVVISMFDEGCVAVVPTITSSNPDRTSSYKIYSMRVGKITTWYPDAVKVLLYNERTGKKEELIFRKKNVAIIENPLYSVINEPNSVLQRLIRKLNLLDAIDEQSGSGKLDLLIQVPYSVRSEGRKKYAEDRRMAIEEQLVNGKFGIAYIDGTERIVQLNRPVENNLMTQIEYLTGILYGQLGMSQGVLDGTADEKVMLNYLTRTIEPIASAIVDEFKRKFLSETALTQGQSIMFFKDPFKLVTVTEIAGVAETFTRNEIATSNEIRQVIGWIPSDDPDADKLKNSNISQPKQEVVEKLTIDSEKEEKPNE